LVLFTLGEHMPAPASQIAMENLRDLSTVNWYVIQLLAIVFYIYQYESKKSVHPLIVMLSLAE